MGKFFTGFYWIVSLIVILDLFLALLRTMLTGSVIIYSPFIVEAIKFLALLIIGYASVCCLILMDIGHDQYHLILEHTYYFLELTLFFLASIIGSFATAVISVIRLPFEILSFLLESTPLVNDSFLGIDIDSPIMSGTCGVYIDSLTLHISLTAPFNVASFHVLFSVFGDAVYIAGNTREIHILGLYVRVHVTGQTFDPEYSFWNLFIQPALDLLSSSATVESLQELVDKIVSEF